MARAAVEFAKTIIQKKPIVAEVGVYMGEHAREICECLDPSMIYLVDTIKRFEVFPRSGDGKWPYTFFEEKSQVGASHLPDECLDFVYIDALHDEVNMAIDIACWYQKVKVGGVIGGHDYGQDPNQSINSAVRRMFGLDVYSKDVDWWHVKKVSQWFQVK
jgi:hypothetical protein